MFNEFISQCNTIWLQNNDEIETARQYLFTRGMSIDDINRYSIGYCCSDSYIPKSVRFIEKSDKQFDYANKIKGKIIVPIHDEFGKIVAFATRSPSFEEDSTWWNYPFKKSNYLYLLDKAKSSIFKENIVFIVEGYMDAITLFSYGIKNVVAVMGTALTSRQIGLIARYCNRICFLFDCDENNSGQKAFARSSIAVYKYNFCEELYKIVLPMGEDPDSFVLKNGSDNLKKLMVGVTSKEIIAMEQQLMEKRR